METHQTRDRRLSAVQELSAILVHARIFVRFKLGFGDAQTLPRQIAMQATISQRLGKPLLVSSNPDVCKYVGQRERGLLLASLAIEVLQAMLLASEEVEVIWAHQKRLLHFVVLVFAMVVLAGAGFGHC